MVWDSRFRRHGRDGEDKTLMALFSVAYGMQGIQEGDALEMESFKIRPFSGEILLSSIAGVDTTLLWQAIWKTKAPVTAGFLAW